VLDAVERGDVATARELLMSHLQRASDILEQRVAGTLESSVSAD
jgi:DNA-binding GntR family transcriptional regulator